jgi:hypothetical protein
MQKQRLALTANRAGFGGLSYDLREAQGRVRDTLKRFELDFCTSDAQYRLASKVGKGRAHRVSGERVFIEREFAEIGQDSLSSEKFLVNQRLGRKTRSARQIAGQAWLGHF